MDKNAIKKYAVWARRELISRVSQKALQYGISEKGCVDKNADSVNGKLLTAEEKHQRAALIDQINKKGYEQVMEEVAYTWFNRFCALRFMEVNGYLPTHVRVFSDEENNFKPQILTEAINLDLQGLKLDKVYQFKSDNKEEELFKYLIIVQCNALQSILPGMFQKISDYTELLFPDNLLRQGSVLEQLVTQIPEENFNVGSESGQIEIIGWLYQYYISEKHEEVVDPLHGKIVKKEEVPAATQLFTTDWVVRYLIDNSVGRYWIERNPESKLKNDLQYFVLPKNGELKYINEKIDPKDLTVLDPCVGSGHFLIYAFDVLIKIYTECGYSARDAVKIIINNNLFGLDIDERATQLAYFSVMMKARQYDRCFFERGVQPKILTVNESNNVDTSVFDYIVNGNYNLKNDLQQIIDTFYDAKEYGSILQIPNVDIKAIKHRFYEIVDDINFYKEEALNKYQPMIEVAEILSRKYAVVATNPPYLNKFDSKLKSFIESNYKAYGGDLFSVFIYRNLMLCKENGYSGYMTPFVWMFIKTYEKLREYIIQNKSITTLIQMEYSAYEEATVPICTFVLKNGKETSNGLYFRLSDFKGGMDIQRQKVLEGLQSAACKYFYESSESNFSKIPGSPIAYWVNNNLANAFYGKKIEDYFVPKFGMSTGDGNKFIRFWFEVSYTNLVIDCNNANDFIATRKSWCVCDKGGYFRKWYGNKEYCVLWRNDGFDIRNHPKSAVRNSQYFFMPHISWTLVTSGKFNCRRFEKGFILDTASNCIYYKDERYANYVLGYLNTKVVQSILELLNPTINVSCGVVASVPFSVDKGKAEKVSVLVDKNIFISKTDWDSFETSWDFKKHPLI